jgi:hypothetical protein
MADSGFARDGLATVEGGMKVPAIVRPALVVV